MSKYRGFLGLLFFFADEPELLPWDTTKTDITAEAIVYQRALNLMYNAARPVLTYLNSLYSTDEVESATAKAASERIESAPITRVVSLQEAAFSPPQRRAPSTVNIQFSAKLDDINRVRTHLRNPGLSARKIAEMALDYYLENEVG